MLGALIGNLYQSLPRIVPSGQIFSSIAVKSSVQAIVGSPWSLTINRTKVRNHFPKPNERRRIKRHGWFTRMSTPSGRKILMRRILKGKHVLSH